MIEAVGLGFAPEGCGDAYPTRSTGPLAGGTGEGDWMAAFTQRERLLWVRTATVADRPKAVLAVYARHRH